MRRAWITLLGILGLVTTSCRGFTVERSSAGTIDSRNWSSSNFPIERRVTIEKMFNGEINSRDIENILRDSEIRHSIKLPDEKCSSTSEDPKRAKRSDDILNTTNGLTNGEKIVSEIKETTNVPSSMGMKNSETIVVSSPKIMKISGTSSVSSSPKTMKTSESTIAVSTAGQMKTSEIISDKSIDGDSLKNVVLLLIDDAGTLEANFLKQLEAAIKFPVQGFLQNCHNAEISESTKFSLGDSMISRKNVEECECDRFLRENIGSLLSWARQIKEMTTGAFSTTNFSIPLSLGYDKPTSPLVNEFEANDEINKSHDAVVPHLKSEPTDIWRSFDIEKETFDEKQSTPTVSANPIRGKSPKQEGVDGYDGMMNVFDMFSRIRIAFFRILLESLGNMARTENEFSEKRTRSVQPSLVEVVRDAIGELKSLSNDKGFILVAAAPGNELTAAIDFLQREISIKDTLLVITGICSSNNEPVPFYARGPGEKTLRKARTIWDLPGLIRGAINDGCYDKSCNNELPPEPVALPSLEISSMSQELPRKRVGRVAPEEEVSDSTTDEKSTKEPDDEIEEEKVTPEVEKRSGASDIRVDNVAKILGIVTSFATMLALNSS